MVFSFPAFGESRKMDLSNSMISAQIFLNFLEKRFLTEIIQAF